MQTPSSSAKIQTVAEMIQKYPKTVSKQAFLRLDPAARKKEITDVLTGIGNSYLYSSLNFIEKTSPEFVEVAKSMSATLSMSGGKRKKYSQMTRKQTKSKAFYSRKNAK
jgi:hypothetical protein